jgi:hypothetical protein
VATPTHIAIDIALLLPNSLGLSLTALNLTLQTPPDGFHFDATHLPHVTLIQQFAQRHDLKAIASVVDNIVEHQLPLKLSTMDISCAHASSTLGVGLTDDLETLHRRLMERLQPFRDQRDRGDGNDQDAFLTDGDGPRAADIEWVSTFRQQSSLQRFNPHITIGVGTLAARVTPSPFLATQLALCQLGRFCTCRRVLHAWTLTASAR